MPLYALMVSCWLSNVTTLSHVLLSSDVKGVKTIYNLKVKIDCLLYVARLWRLHAGFCSGRSCIRASIAGQWMACLVLCTLSLAPVVFVGVLSFL